MKRTEIKGLLQSDSTGIEVCVKGWVRAFRSNRFIALNDGSSMSNIQVVVDFENFDEAILKRVTIASSISVTGELIPSQGQGQSVEIVAKTIEIIGDADVDEVQKTILQPKRHTLERLREQAHLRFRTNTFGAVFRIRHALSFAIHKYFNDNGFNYLHTPIVTGSDAEGAGEIFKVTTLDLGNVPKTDDGKINYEDDFFGKETNLTVSGQLEAELGAMALGKVYTFGPTFRAENSNTTRHLAEFWMMEPEVAFNNLDDNMDLAEDFMKYCINHVIENCGEELKFLENRLLEEEKVKPQDQRSPMALMEKLNFVANNDFVRITYTEAIDILRNSKPNKKKKFEYLIDSWGADLQSEHERFLVEKHFKKPVILTNYPADIKAFYMRQDDELPEAKPGMTVGPTVSAMDILFPGIGEIVGGSQREERYDKLEQAIEKFKIPKESIWWYLDTRRFGTVPHSGFGLGFERFVQFCTGMTNIRDVIPFPRTPKNAEF